MGFRGLCWDPLLLIFLNRENNGGTMFPYKGGTSFFYGFSLLGCGLRAQGFRVAA